MASVAALPAKIGLPSTVDSILERSSLTGLTGKGLQKLPVYACGTAGARSRRNPFQTISACHVAPNNSPIPFVDRRATLAAIVGTAVVVGGASVVDEAHAVSTSRRALRSSKIPEDQFTELPNGLKYYDTTVGDGDVVKKGQRIVVHYVAKWKGITFMTSRQGAGVTGGNPYGFDVGASERGNVLKGLDLGVEGMREHGQRVLLIPPSLAYGSKGYGEIPPDATIEMDVELLTIKKNASGFQVKLVEG